MGATRLLRGLLAVIVSAAAGGAPASAEAATISSVATVALPGSSTGTIGPVGLTPSPNNDNVAVASANLVPISIFFNAIGIADVEFDLASSGGTTEYQVTTSLVNNTGVAWDGFKFELGFGTGTNFVFSSPTDALDFDAPDRDPAFTSSLDTGSRVFDSDFFSWGFAAPGVLAGDSLAFTYAIDVPDGSDRFTLRLIPSQVPEPASLALFGFGLGGLGFLRCRRAS